MKSFVHLLFIGLFAGVGEAGAQPCQATNNLMTCPALAPGQTAPARSYTQRSPTMTHYSYTKPQTGMGQNQGQANELRPVAQLPMQAQGNQFPQPAMRHGRPQFNQQAWNAEQAANALGGSTGYAVNGAVNPSSVGIMSYYNNGVAKQGAAPANYYAAKPCQQIATMAYCN